MKTPKGTRDLLPEDTRVFQMIEKRALEHFGRYGFEEIRTPIFEDTALFIRGIGTETDIVSKEIYQFESKGGASLALRPEMTAAVCRAVIQHHLVGRDEIVRLLYNGPMFRYERPQAGRYRQFHQIGAEVFGSQDPLIDVETIQALMAFLEPYQLPNLGLNLNSVGDDSDRPQYLQYLRDTLEPQAGAFCQDCQTRMEKNVLRLLDCKVPSCQEKLAGLKPISEFWSTENRKHFDAVCNGLTRLGISFDLNPKLVRGLDYYTKTAFELVSGDLGAQSAVMGGGRYDKLVSAIGGPDIPAFGWALGVDRLATLLQQNGLAETRQPDCFFVFAHRDGLEENLKRICDLRSSGISCLYDLRTGSFKSQMKRANKSHAKYSVILGERELEQGVLTVKNMATSEQNETTWEQLPNIVK